MRSLIIAAALLLSSATARAADTDVELPSHRGGIVASEVHPAPTIGPELPAEPIAAAPSARTQCAAGWTSECNAEGECTCLPF